MTGRRQHPPLRQARRKLFLEAHSQVETHQSSPPPPLPPPLPAFEAATVAQAAQNRPFEAAPPPYTPPAGYVAPVGVDPSVVPSAPAEAGKKSNLILFIAIGGAVVLLLLIAVAVLAYLFLFR